MAVDVQLKKKSDDGHRWLPVSLAEAPEMALILATGLKSLCFLTIPRWASGLFRICLTSLGLCGLWVMAGF